MTNVLAAELDLENLLLRIPDVLGARVRVAPEGTVQKIHILANRAARTRRLSFDVERLLAEERALRLDPGVVSVVALEDAQDEPAQSVASAWESPRIEYRRLAFQPADQFRVRALVELKLNEILFTGQACETDVPQARPPLAARAVLAALEFLREQGAAFYLDGIEFMNGFHAPVALAMITVLSTREKRTLTGCALVTDSREEAAARATLAALNRFYGSLRSSAAP